MVGNGVLDKIVPGPLSSASLHPMYLCVDDDGNIFVVSRGQGKGDERSAILRIDEEAGELIMLKDDMVGNVPCVNNTTGIVTISTETTIGSYLSLDPLEMWGLRI